MPPAHEKMKVGKHPMSIFTTVGNVSGTPSTEGHRKVSLHNRPNKQNNKSVKEIKFNQETHTTGDQTKCSELRWAQQLIKQCHVTLERLKSLQESFHGWIKLRTLGGERNMPAFNKTHWMNKYWNIKKDHQAMQYYWRRPLFNPDTDLETHTNNSG